MRDLFDDPPKPLIQAPDHWKDEEQIANAERVGGAIGRAVYEFCRARPGCEFRMEELRTHVGQHRAPDSAGRILRLLRQNGLIEYAVVNRAQSLYKIAEDYPEEATDGQ